MDVVIITWELLTRHALGPYGNEWVETSTWDRMAAAGYTFDRCYSSRTIDEALPIDAASIGRLSQTHEFCFLREAEATAPQTGLADVAWRTVDGVWGTDVPPRSLPFARLIEAGASWWKGSSSKRSRLLWLHSQGIPFPCPAPRDVGTFYGDEFALQGIDLLAFSEEELSAHVACYGGVATLFDLYLGEVLDPIFSADRPALVVLAGLRSHAVFSRRMPASTVAALQDESVHVPAVVCPVNPDGSLAPAGQRISNLCRIQDVLQSSLESVAENGRDLRTRLCNTRHDVLTISDGRGSLARIDEHSHAILASDSSNDEYYQMPEDCWCRNNLAKSFDEMLAKWRHDSARQEPA